MSYAALDYRHLSVPFTDLGEWVSLLDKIVKINSEYLNIDGVLDVQKIVAARASDIGFHTKFVENPNGASQSAPLLLAEIPGQIPLFITLVCHADTVFPKKVPHNFEIIEDRAYGPGVVDNKGGILVALWGVQQFLQSSPFSKFGIRLVCSPNEEIGSTGFHNYFKELSRDSVVVLGFEPAADGDLIAGRKGNRWYDIHIKGKRAHSGRDHKKGVNACFEMAMKLSKIQALTDYKNDVTVNIGRIEGGEKYNIVSEYAYGQVDLRFPDFESRDIYHKNIESILNQESVKTYCGKFSSDISYEIVDDCPPFSPTEEGQKIFSAFKESIDKYEDLDLDWKVVGGAADSNHLSTPSNIVMDGLGPIGGKMHTKNEYIVLSSLETRSKALSELLMRMNQEILAYE